MFRLPKDTEMTLDLLAEYMNKHQLEVNERYKKLQDTYMSDHAILHRRAKPDWKPDNRIVVNFAKYIVDTMNGFFLGNPIKITTDNEKAAEFVEYLDQYNMQDDNNAELAKTCDIFGEGYEMYYTDEKSELNIVVFSPLNAFMIFDESIVEEPLFFIRRYTDSENVEHGSISSRTHVRYFRADGSYKWESEWEPHYFDGVPATEFVENKERQGIFEPVLSMIDAYDKAMSEKANDVDYFADAYMKIIGPDLTEEDLRYIRDKRVINYSGLDISGVDIGFLDKPSGDGTQENLINRLERLIYQISMVANISDENFGTSSGIALKYKLQAMLNLAKAKQRKFEAGMNRRYKLLFSHPAAKGRVGKDDWVGLHYQFTPNIPANVLEEAQTAAQLEGIVSQDTQLKLLSIVDDVKAEKERIEEDNKSGETAVERFMFPNNEGAVNDEP